MKAGLAVLPMHPELYTALCCVFLRHITHSMCYSERWNIFVRSDTSEVDGPYSYIFHNTQRWLDFVVQGTLCIAIAVDIFPGCLFAQLLLMVEPLVPLQPMSPHSALATEDIRLPHVLPLDSVCTIHSVLLAALVKFP